jgi:DNA repair ATPase RecN
MLPPFLLPLLLRLQTSRKNPDVWRQLLEQVVDDIPFRELDAVDQILNSVPPASKQQQPQRKEEGEKEEIRQLQQQLAEQQQQLAASEAECGQLRARVQALEGQVQRLQALRKGSRV